ncbi:hypothetical protein EM595_1433 [Duffyella gerundensis]|jgi:hypothetical protein|uniref:Uncharacterized protein n=1 Tax=Duffyella gerundensis TaxID=1619313 RepID=A0A0U5L4Q7_9GAMM|nr:hypothetical protein EM595_1433 [Duffyella gerundensis]
MAELIKLDISVPYLSATLTGIEQKGAPVGESPTWPPKFIGLRSENLSRESE